MGRRRTRDHDLPPLMIRRRGRYYYGRQGLALGADFRTALRKYAEYHTGHAVPGTFADAADMYRRSPDGMKARAPKTQAEYSRQLDILVGAFGTIPLAQIRPVAVQGFLGAAGEKRVDSKGRETGGRIIATRMKALLSLVFNFARASGLTDAPNPCAGIRGTKSKRHVYVEDADLRTAIERADPIVAGFLELCYLTGQRPGDVVRMRRSDVIDGALCVQQGKTGAKVRIAVVGPLAALLERLQRSTSGGVDGHADHPGDRRPLSQGGKVAHGGPASFGSPSSAGIKPGPLTRIASLYLIRDERGQPFTLAALRKRFKRLGYDWQIRDLRAKAASDSANAKDAQTLLGHAAVSTTDGYIRQRAGTKARPIMRKVTK